MLSQTPRQVTTPMIDGPESKFLVRGSANWELLGEVSRDKKHRGLQELGSFERWDPVIFSYCGWKKSGSFSVVDSHIIPLFGGFHGRVPPNGGFISWKIPSTNGWLAGVPLNIDGKSKIFINFRESQYITYWLLVVGSQIIPYHPIIYSVS